MKVASMIRAARYPTAARTLCRWRTGYIKIPWAASPATVTNHSTTPTESSMLFAARVDR